MEITMETTKAVIALESAAKTLLVIAVIALVAELIIFYKLTRK